MGNNELIEQILSVMQTLVLYGFYQEPSIRDGVIKALRHILDGKNDKPHEGMEYTESMHYMYVCWYNTRCNS